MALSRSGLVIDAEWKSGLPQREGKLAILLDAFIRKTALDLEGLIKQNIASKGIVDTGNYLNSWHVEVEGNAKANIVSRSADLHSSVNYGIFHEFGTTRIRPRPHVIPAVEAISPRIQENIRIFRGLE